MFSANINLIGYLFACKCLCLCILYLSNGFSPNVWHVYRRKHTHENVSILLHRVFNLTRVVFFGCCLFFGVFVHVLPYILTPSSRQQTKHAMRQAIHQRLFIFVQFTHSLTHSLRSSSEAEDESDG